MKIKIIAFVMVSMISCRNRNHTPSAAQPVSEPRENLNIQANSFTEVDTTGVLIFPLTMGESTGRDRSSYYKEMPDNSYWNILFVNSKTNEQHLLSEGKMLIRGFDLNDGQDERPATVASSYIFYNLVAEDLNRDKLYTEDDPDYLFISDRQGYHFRQVSPSGYDIRTWEYIKASGKVFMIVCKDSDQNYKYDNEDELAVFEADIVHGNIATEVFRDTLKGQLRKLYDQQWKKIKK